MPILHSTWPGTRGRPHGVDYPDPFVLSVWSVTIACFLVLWFVMPTFDHDCLSPCDAYAYAALGVLELGIALLILAKLLWIIWARVRR